MKFGKKEQDMSEFEFAASVLQEKLDRMQNPYSPLANKLRSTIGLLKYRDKTEKCYGDLIGKAMREVIQKRKDSELKGI